MKNFLHIFLIVMIPVASAQTSSTMTPDSPDSQPPTEVPAPDSSVAPPPSSGNTVVVMPPANSTTVPAATTTEPVIAEAPKRSHPLPTGDIRACLRFEDSAKVIACAERPGRYL
jgi:hypothetical protein